MEVIAVTFDFSENSGGTYDATNNFIIGTLFRRPSVFFAAARD
jgi:hypothetical protein